MNIPFQKDKPLIKNVQFIDINCYSEIRFSKYHFTICQNQQNTLTKFISLKYPSKAR